MNIEQQVCSFALSKRLKELGIKQDSLFSYFDTETYGLVIRLSDYSFDLDAYLSVQRIGNAYTSAELGELLPIRIDGYPLNEQYKCDSENYVWLYKTKDENSEVMIADKNEANCRAKMLISLIENNLWKPEA